ncbi:MAG: LuxR family transcriptional regulator [Frankiales bacterium]|nr:MAG: LuxR family transcriptional regulator [Frankiales bacterium]
MSKSPSVELAEIAASADDLPRRSEEMLLALRRVVPFDAAWLALAEPRRSCYASLASVDLDRGALKHLGGPRIQPGSDVTQTDRARPPPSLSDLPYPAAALLTWGECLLPAGVHGALAVGLFGSGRRHVGFLALLYASRQPPSLVARRRLQGLTGVLALGIDPLRSLASAARVVRGASAGAVLCSTGATGLPGLAGDALLADGSPVVLFARSCIDDGQVFASFLWPRGGRHAPEGHVRVTVLADPGGASAGVVGAVVLSPVPDLHGLTPRELEVLGLLVEGCANQQIARALVVTTRTVAAHVEHILVKLSAPTRTFAAVRAAREGLYVPFGPVVVSALNRGFPAGLVAGARPAGGPGPVGAVARRPAPG